MSIFRELQTLGKENSARVVNVSEARPMSQELLGKKNEP